MENRTTIYNELKQVAVNLSNVVNDLMKLAQTEEQETAPKSQFLNIEQACKFLGISKNRLYRLTSNKEISYTRPNGRHVFFKIEDLETWQNRNRQKSKYEIETELAQEQVEKL